MSRGENARGEEEEKEREGRLAPGPEVRAVHDSPGASLGTRRSPRSRGHTGGRGDQGAKEMEGRRVGGNGGHKAWNGSAEGKGGEGRDGK